MFARAAIAFAWLACAGCLFSTPRPLPSTQTDPSYVRARERLAAALQHAPHKERAKNVVLFIGDGMDVTTVTAARIRAGQLAGGTGEEFSLGWEDFPHVSLAKTYNSNQQVPDSAGTATAMLAGVKTKAGVIGVGPTAVRGDCASSQPAELPSLFTLAEERGLSTGVVTTTRITHATPAAAYAHGPERGWEVDRAIPSPEAQAGCRDFALQLVEFPAGDGLEVALGGGQVVFLPDDPRGGRADGRRLTHEWVSRSPAHAFVRNAEELAAVEAQVTHLLGLFTKSHMSYEVDRPASEPSLEAMTRAAIALLSRNEAGFVLLVEGGRIDHAHHQGNAHRALQEVIELSRAVEAARTLLDPAETLIVVTADHGHTLTMSGYPTRGNGILDVVRANDSSGAPESEPFLAGDGLPYTTLSYGNGPGAVRGRRPAPLDPEAPDYRQQALYPMSFSFPNGAKYNAETHGGQDVGIWAIGPGARLFQGTVEQNYVFHVLQHALGLPPR